MSYVVTGRLLPGRGIPGLVSITREGMEKKREEGKKEWSSSKKSSETTPNYPLHSNSQVIAKSMAELEVGRLCRGKG